MSDNIESSLIVDYSTLKNRVARIIAAPADEMRWNEQQRKAVDACIEDGLRQYYEPPAVDQFGPHVWSFLYPTGYVTTEDGRRWYDLPPEFSHLQAAGAVSNTDSSRAFQPLEVTSESRLRELANAEGDSEGRPRCVAVRMKESRGAGPQQWEIGFHPIPDSTYEFAFNYYAAPYMVTEDRPYPLGGQAHSQGILLSCLAAAELYEFEIRGQHYAAFVEQLKADIAHDAKRGPSTLGYGGVSRRGGIYGAWDSRFRQTNNDSVTYNGTSY
jgi:hypothetical protein